MHRRDFLVSGATSAALAASGTLQAQEPRKPSQFQIACMTLPYAQFPFARALQGIQAAGYKFVAWGITHKEPGGQDVPLLAPDASPQQAKDLAARCRDRGLEPVLMFSTVYPEARDGLAVLTQRLKQAGAAGVPQVLTFGHTKGGDRKLWIERLKVLGPIARDNHVLLVIKQHGGETGTGEACAEITRAVVDANIKVNYDAGNVLDYLNKDPIPDIKTCAEEIRSFCIKDHRNWPRSEDCGIGLGEIDHYKLLSAVAFTGLTIPLACENIFAPLVARPTRAEDIDQLARRSREYLELVIAGLQMSR